jgi:hypothetical protein
VHPCTGTEDLYRPYGKVHRCTGRTVKCTLVQARRLSTGLTVKCTLVQAQKICTGRTVKCTLIQALRLSTGRTVKCTLVQALRLSTGRTAHRGRIQLYPFMTTALEGVRVQRHTPAALYPRKRPGTHRWFDPRWCHGIFHWHKSFWSHYGPGVDSASNRNEYQEYFLGVNAAGA